MRRLDLTNRKVGKLTPKFPLNKNGKVYWFCICDCGESSEVNTDKLVRQRIKSCGCEKNKHNMTKTKTYSVWERMRRRCDNPLDKDYPEYGGRGIGVSDEWRDFRNFYRDMGEAPVGLTLERLDVNGNYCKENCKWATRKEQARNRRNNVNIAHNGEYKCVSAWAEHYGIEPEKLRRRVKSRGSLEAALA